MSQSTTHSASASAVRATKPPRTPAGKQAATQMAAWERALRVIVAVAGGWLLTNLTVSWIAFALAAAGLLPRGEAIVLMQMLGFIVYLCVLVWAFAERSLARLCGIVIAGVAIGLVLTKLLFPLVDA